MSFRNVTLLFLCALTSITLSCAGKSDLLWKAIPTNRKNVRFDSNTGLLIAEIPGVKLTFTPLPKVKQVGKTFKGTGSVMNTSAGFILVMWETVNLSDFYGFFKTFRFGQTFRLPISFPTENTVISSGNQQAFTFSFEPEDYEKVVELIEHSTFAFILPVKFPEDSEPTIIRVEYTIREAK